MTTGANTLLRPEERELFARILSAWGAAPEIVEDTLREAVSGRV